MSMRFEIRRPLEPAYARRALFAIEVRDAVSLARLTNGISVRAVGLRGRPRVNYSGLFTWLAEDRARFEKLVVEPWPRPFEPVEVAAAAIVDGQVNVVALNPLPSYPFAGGTTAIRGELRETAPSSGNEAAGIAGATVRLAWLDDNGSWIAAAQRFTTRERGQFAAFLPFDPADAPKLDPEGALTLRLYARRGATEYFREFPHPLGRVADATYDWDRQLQP